MTTTSGRARSSSSSQRVKTPFTPWASAILRAAASSRWQTATTSQPLAWNAGMWARPKPSPMTPTVGPAMRDASRSPREGVGGGRHPIARRSAAQPGPDQREPGASGWPAGGLGDENTGGGSVVDGDVPNDGEADGMPGEVPGRERLVGSPVVGSIGDVVPK